MPIGVARSEFVWVGRSVGGPALGGTWEVVRTGDAKGGKLSFLGRNWLGSGGSSLRQSSFCKFPDYFLFRPTRS